MKAGEMSDLIVQAASFINTDGASEKSIALLENLLPDLRGDLKMGLITKVSKNIVNELFKSKKVVELLANVIKQSKQ
jgi:hypothetical protein